VLLATSVNAQRYSFDLDVPSARFSLWRIEDIGKATHLVADLEVRELRKDSQFIPAFQLALFDDADKKVALILRRNGGKDTLNGHVQASEAGKVTDERPLNGWEIGKKQKFHIDMNWSAAGFLIVSADGTELGRFPLSIAPHSLTVSASTGELYGHSLSLAEK
jgi:hypothetical protein